MLNLFQKLTKVWNSLFFWTYQCEKRLYQCEKSFYQCEKSFCQCEKSFCQCEKSFCQCEKSFCQCEKRFCQCEKSFCQCEKSFCQCEKSFCQCEKSFCQCEKKRASFQNRCFRKSLFIKSKNRVYETQIFLYQNKPVITPSSSTSILSADGAFGKPGISIISPANATTKPAPL